MIETTTRIGQLMVGLYTGPNWVSVDILSTLNGLAANQAAKRILPESNTIWEIINHMIGWRKHILRRLDGEDLPSPGHNYIQEVVDQSDDAWKETLRELDDTQKAWQNYLKDFNEDKFDRLDMSTHTTYYVLVHGIIQHDYYHLGQIKMMVKYV